MKSVDGAMRSGNGMLLAKAVTANQLGATGTVTVNGVAVSTVYGYAQNAVELRKVLDMDAKILAGAACGGGAELCLYHSDVTTGTTTCYVRYVAAVDANTPPTYTQTLSNCS
jgi:hypothetical protein